MTIPDRLEKQIHLNSSIERVWRALSDSREFGSWFGMELGQPFVVGERLLGKMRPTQVEPEVAKLQAPHDGKPCGILVERLDPQHRFSFRWHPGDTDPLQDGAVEPTTRIEFELTPTETGTLLRITESGFHDLPLEQRAAAFAANDQGWEIQTRLIAKYLQRNPA